MSSHDDGSESITTSTPDLEVRKSRSPNRIESPGTSTTSLPLRISSPATLASRNSALNTLSRSSSPTGRLSLSLGRFGRSSIASPLANPSESNDDIRSLIVRAYSPLVALFAASEVEDLCKNRGIQGGWLGLLRPFGERIPGKVVVRDSTGASRAWEDFGMRFADLGQLASDAVNPNQVARLDEIEELLDQYLDRSDDDIDVGDGAGVSPYYQLLLGRLLSSQHFSQHEAFLHPVATIITISSSTPSPIETLRSLYQQTAQGSHSLPPYANAEYLRYYVLVHDDDRDDFSKSSALFDQMKRHFGLHCHLLRLGPVVHGSMDENAEQLPTCEWLTAQEDLDHLQKTTQLLQLEGAESNLISSANATAIRTFVRELAAQSIVPHMEQRIATWNEQIASKRRGISGRFMSISKRWAGFGSSSRTSSALNLTGSGASGNFDSTQEQYRYDTPEALLRRMADFAMMLRDYKLAASTYELLRSDYSNDKAWKYLAGANEMCCAATLLNPLASGNAKLKSESFDQMLETASYSYLTQCSQPSLALRSMLLGVELLKVRGPAASEMATKWAIRALQMNLLGSIGHVLVSERVTGCLAARVGMGSAALGVRKRKAAMWSVIAADEWMKLGRADFAAIRLDEAQNFYQDTKYPDAVKSYDHLTDFTAQLQLTVKIKISQGRSRGFSGSSQLGKTNFDDEQEELEEPTEELERLDTKPHRKSMIGTNNPLDTAPLSPIRLGRPDPLPRDDDFE